MAVAANLLIKSFGRNAVYARQVFIEQYALPANGDYPPFEIGIESFHTNHTSEGYEKLHEAGRKSPMPVMPSDQRGAIGSISSRY